MDGFFERLKQRKLVQCALAYVAAVDPNSTIRCGQSEWSLMQAALGPLHCDADFVALVKHVQTTDPHYTKLCGAKP